VGFSALKPGATCSLRARGHTIELAELDPPLDAEFRAWIEQVTEIDRWSGDGVSSGTFRDYQEQRPNNVGLVVGASRIAVEMYLGRTEHRQHLAAADASLRGFLGDTSAYRYPQGSFGGPRNDNSLAGRSDPGSPCAASTRRAR
jgi:hypothetical protein